MLKGNSKPMKCRSGLITELIDWGVATHFEDQLKCVKKKEDVCFSVLNDKLVQKYIKDNCMGKSECILSGFDKFILQTGADKQAIKRCLLPTSRLYF